MRETRAPRPSAGGGKEGGPEMAIDSREFYTPQLDHSVRL